MKYKIPMPKKRDTYASLLDKIASLYKESMQDLSEESRNERVVAMNWNMGKYIVEVEQNGSARAKYGDRKSVHRRVSL